jgi:hypothetical protein
LTSGHLIKFFFLKKEIKKNIFSKEEEEEEEEEKNRGGRSHPLGHQGATPMWAKIAAVTPPSRRKRVLYFYLKVIIIP